MERAPIRGRLPGVLFVVLLAACGGGGDGDAPTSDAAGGDGAAVDVGAGADAAPQPDGTTPSADGAGTGGGGACTSAADAPIVAGETGVDVDAEVPICARTLLMGGATPADDDFADRMSACIAAATGLTPACAACYGANADCGADSCLGLCIVDPEAQACVDCRCGRTGPVNCIQAFVDCSGLPDDTCD